MRLFLDFNPLIFITTILSAHAAAKAFYFSLITIVITLVFGRVFCGWACPLGTLNNLVGSIRKNKPADLYVKGYRVKYYILIAVLVSALFTLQPVGFIDPLSLLIRSLSVSVYPLFNYSVRSTFDTIYAMNLLGSANITEPVYRVLKKTVLSFDQSFYKQSVLMGSLFFIVLGLNLIEEVLVQIPLPARRPPRHLFAIFDIEAVSERRMYLLRNLRNHLPGNARPDAGEHWKDTECLVCWNCDDICPQNAVSFGFLGKRLAAAMDLGRRRSLHRFSAG